MSCSTSPTEHSWHHGCVHDDDPPGGQDDAPTPPGVDQFQRAALDAVRALRAMLDAAETVIADPAAVESVVRTVTSMARTAGETVVGFAAAAGRAAASAGGMPTDEDDDEGPEPGFQRIHVD